MVSVNTAHFANTPAEGQIEESLRLGGKNVSRKDAEFEGKGNKRNATSP